MLEQLLKINYRPVSILPTLSKIYEKVFSQQKCTNILIIFFLNTDVDSERVKAQIIICYSCWNP